MDFFFVFLHFGLFDLTNQLWQIKREKEQVTDVSAITRVMLAMHY
jgi:hypothetical protein